MKRVYLTRALFVILLASAIGWMSVRLLSVDLPQGKSDFYADVLARKIEKATVKSDFDNFRYLKWTSVRDYEFIWDKSEEEVIVSKDDLRVLLNLKQLDSSLVMEQGILSKDPNANTKNIQKAYSQFCNDSFWVIAPYKLFDKGVERKIVQVGAEKLLLIQYTSGGVTPGDSYLWRTDKTFLPTSIQMWTEKIPIDGIQVTWENYKTVSGQAKIALSHKFGPINLAVKHLEAGNAMQDLKLEENPFLLFH